MIPPKLYLRMTDYAEELHQERTDEADRRLVDFQDDVGWPHRASCEQLNDWNERMGTLMLTPNA